MLAWMSYNFPFLPINLQVSSSTLACKIRKRSWLFVNIRSKVFISSLRVFKHAISRARIYVLWIGICISCARACIHTVCLKQRNRYGSRVQLNASSELIQRCGVFAGICLCAVVYFRLYLSFVWRCKVPFLFSDFFHAADTVCDSAADAPLYFCLLFFPLVENNFLSSFFHIVRLCFFMCDHHNFH